MVTIFAIGIVVSLLVEEITGYSPGGVVVPGFVALALHEPSEVVATLAVALLALGVYRLLEPRMLLYGRRRFGFLVLTGLLLKAGLLGFLPQFGVLPYGLLVIGYVVPGVLADTCARQGVLPTLATLALAAGSTRLIAAGVMGW